MRKFFLLLFILSLPLVLAVAATTQTVTNTAGLGAGSFLQALTDASAGDTIAFNIPITDGGYTAQTVGGTDLHYWLINLPPGYTISTDSLTIDGSTQTTNLGDTNPYGPEIVFKGATALPTIGLDFSGVTGCILKNVVVYNCEQANLRITPGSSSNNTITGCYIGVDATGEAAQSSTANGISIYGANNIIGGTTAGERNIISGNNFGVFIQDTTGNYNTVEGNYIGTDVSGTAAIPNTNAGVAIYTGGTHNLIGGTASGARNIISGNNGSDHMGVFLQGTGTNSNEIIGNYIGVDVTGEAALANDTGVYISSNASFNLVQGNVLSGNTQSGIDIGIGAGTICDSNLVKGNYIGTDANGTSAVGNGNAAIILHGAAIRTIIGGTTDADRNIISGTTGNGYGIYFASNSNEVTGNYIGTDITGIRAIANLHAGLQFDAASSHHLIENNLIAHNENGAYVNEGSSNNFFTGNTFAYNVGNGVYIDGSTSEGNTITQNSFISNNAPAIGLDHGANNNLASPEITSGLYDATAGTASLEGTSPVGAMTIEVFQAENTDEAHSYGQTYRGAVASSAGSWSALLSGFTSNLAIATVTDGSGNTSRFSSRLTMSTVSPTTTTTTTPSTTTTTLPDNPIANVVINATPATISINFMARSSGEARLSIYDPSGAVVAQEPLGSVRAGGNDISRKLAKRLPKGPYIYLIELNGYRQTGKLTIAE